MAAVANPGKETQFAAVREELERILASQMLRNAVAQKKFLRFVVEEALPSRWVGWQLSGLFTATDGSPFSVTDGFNQSGLGNNIRPNVVPGCNAFVGNVNEWFNPACFVAQPVGTLGNEGHNTLTLPGITNFDLALLKDTRVPKISESFSVQFWAEFINIFNHANFGPPAVGDFVQGTNGGANISTSAGRITTTTTNSRQTQFGLKILF